MEPPRGLNVVPVGGREFLLTVTAGNAVHLSKETGPDETARSAIPDWQLRPQQMNARVRWHAYDRAALAEPRWAETTLCGRLWIAMAGDEDGNDDEPATPMPTPWRLSWDTWATS